MMAAEKLRDLSQPIDVGVLDATVAAFYGTGSKDEVIKLMMLLRYCLWSRVSVFEECGVVFWACDAKR
ncbi:hypothetical protein CTI12_AA625090 [Artemisia annua]|uniref:Uncharacterized protein n=1 Tax=Artemisia annua TaxID=35608 RepID=A0A2U1KAD9_ARTAN|nr:hypothetical protein CTI12_AA625090 [Artemisia annua]